MLKNLYLSIVERIPIAILRLEKAPKDKNIHLNKFMSS